MQQCQYFLLVDWRQGYEHRNPIIGTVPKLKIWCSCFSLTEEATQQKIILLLICRLTLEIETYYFSLFCMIKRTIRLKMIKFLVYICRSQVFIENKPLHYQIELRTWPLAFNFQHGRTSYQTLRTWPTAHIVSEFATREP